MLLQPVPFGLTPPSEAPHVVRAGVGGLGGRVVGARVMRWLGALVACSTWACGPSFFAQEAAQIG
ncbi:MAG: hypothetical protein RL033_7873, partial [Pseudomonadota bacterium]